MVCDNSNIFLIVEICHMIYNVIRKGFVMLKQVKVNDKSEWRFDNNVKPRTNNVQRRTENTLNK